MEDEKIVALYWERAEEAIAATEEKYGKYCSYIACNILNNREDAKECVNDTWLRAWNAIPPGRPGHLATFLGKITRNLAINRLEKERAKKRGGGKMEVFLEELSDCLFAGHTGEETADFIIRDAMDRFLSALPAESRKLFVRRYWYFSSIREIAKDYKISESKVKMTLLRTRQELKVFLEKEGIAV
ncbi:MAG: sigma-70 family RNA polymerase sigma factor [Lachnospiraceae bacterium]|nr:sigma-70 family RNA polymerase sigma factor [Lachnospiraceae bacterium]